MKSKSNETRIMLWVLAQLKDRYPESLWERQNVVAARAGDRFIRAGTVGQGDLRGCHKGRYIELEVKVLGQKQTEEQLQREFIVKKAGGVYAVVHNPDEAFAVVERL